MSYASREKQREYHREYHRRWSAEHREYYRQLQKAWREAHPNWTRWWQIKQRCFNSNNASYHNYGGRGITMLPEWAENFRAFDGWLNENLGSCPEGYTLDRIDNGGNYEPSNLRWATPSQQSRNSRRRKLKTHCLHGHEFTKENAYTKSNGKRHEMLRKRKQRAQQEEAA